MMCQIPGMHPVLFPNPIHLICAWGSSGLARAVPKLFPQNLQEKPGQHLFQTPEYSRLIKDWENLTASHFSTCKSNALVDSILLVCHLDLMSQIPDIHSGNVHGVIVDTDFIWKHQSQAATGKEIIVPTPGEVTWILRIVGNCPAPPWSFPRLRLYHSMTKLPTFHVLRSRLEKISGITGILLDPPTYEFSLPIFPIFSSAAQ